MLKHQHPSPQKPDRVILLGAKGFVASAIAKNLADASIKTTAIGSGSLDLTTAGAGEQLAARLQANDVLVFVSAIAPCKTPDTFMANLAMASAVAEAVTKTPPAHLVYISSDAVYRDDLDLVREEDCTQPGGLHGAMHVARESLLRAVYKGPLCILRPSLLYGATDPHNGYGPNRFRRLASAGKTITLFGEGEEKRDHVWIPDVAEIVRRVIEHRSAGTLNIATGQSPSFREVAEQTVALHDPSSPIQGTPRQNPISYRHYDITACQQAFPDFHYTPLAEGVAQTVKEAG